MELCQNKIVLKESPSPDLSFSLTYGRNKSHPENRELSYQILSLLLKQAFANQDQSVFLEIDSSLFLFSTPRDSETLISTLIGDFQKLGVQHRYQTLQSNDTRSLFHLFGINKNTTVHKVFAYISDKTWLHNEFKSCLPGNGLRYYLCKERVDEPKLLEDLSCGKLTDHEKEAIFSLIIYDCSDFGQMGIKTDLSKTEIQSILGI